MCQEFFRSRNQGGISRNSPECVCATLLTFCVKSLQEPAKVKGGPGGRLAGAAATLQLRLLDVYMSLPPATYGEQANFATFIE
jgi:hypothetical protein